MADQILTHAASLVPVAAHAGKPAMPLTRAVITIGTGKHNRIQLKSDTVSTTHALLVHTDGGWYVRDLGSRTHTILNGKVAKEATLKNGDTLTIGAFVFEFRTDARTPEKPVPPAALETAGELPLPIDTKTTAIGRRTGCEVRLEEESASHVHAVLFEIDGVHYVRDLYSRTGTWLNGAKIHQEPLKFGDEIRVGETLFRYVEDHSELYAPPPEESAPQASEPQAMEVAVLPPIALEDEASIPVAASARDTIDADLPEHHEPDDGAPVLPLARRDVLDAGPLAADSFVAAEPSTPLEDAIELAPEPAAADADDAGLSLAPPAAQVSSPTEDAIELAPEPASVEAETTVAAESAEDIEAELLGLAPAAPATPAPAAVERVPEPTSSAAIDLADLVAEPTAEAESNHLGAAPRGETTPLQDAIELAPEPELAAEPELVAERIEAEAEPIAEAPQPTEVAQPAEVAVDRRPPDVIATPAVALDVPPAPPADSVPAAAPEAVERFADQAEAPIVGDEDEAATLAASALGSPLEPTPPPAAEPAAAAPLPEEAASLAKLEADVQAALDDPTRPLPPLLAPGISAADAAARLSEAGRRTRLIAEMLERHEDIEAEVERNPLTFEAPATAPEPVGMAASADEDLLADTAPVDAPPATIAAPIEDVPALAAPVLDEVAPLEFADVPIEAVVPPLPDLEPVVAPIDTEVAPLGLDVEDSLTARADTLTPLVEPVTVDAAAAGPVVAPPRGTPEPLAAAADDVVVEPAAEVSPVGEIAPDAKTAAVEAAQGIEDAKVASIDVVLVAPVTSLDSIAAAPTPAPLPTNEAADVPEVIAADRDEKGVAVDDAQAPIEADAFRAGDVIATSPVVITGLLPDEADAAIEAERQADAERQAAEAAAAPEAITEPDAIAESEAEAVAPAAKGRRGKAAKKTVAKKTPPKAPAPKGRGRKGKATLAPTPVADANVVTITPAAEVAPVAAPIDEVTPAAEVAPAEAAPLAPAAEVIAEAARQDDEADVLGLDAALPPAETTAGPVAEAKPIDFAAEQIAAEPTPVEESSLEPAETAEDAEAAILGLAPAAAPADEATLDLAPYEETEAEAPTPVAEKPAIDRAALEDDEADVLGLTPTAAEAPAEAPQVVEAPPVAETPRTADGITAELAAAQATLGLAPEADEAKSQEAKADAGEAEIAIDQAALDADRADVPAAAEDEFRPMLATPLPLEIGTAPVEALVALDAGDSAVATPALGTGALDLPTQLESAARPLIAADEHLDDRELAAIDAGEMPAASLAAAPLPTINADALTGPAVAPPVEDALPDTLPADAVASAAIVIGDSAEPVAAAQTDGLVADTSPAGVGFVNQFDAAEAAAPVDSIEPAQAELAAEQAELAAQATASGDVALDLIAADEVTAPNEDLGAVAGAVDPVVAAEMVAEPEHLMSLTPAEPTPHEVVHAPSEATADERTNAERLHDFAEPPPPTPNSKITVQSDAPTAVVTVERPTAEQVTRAAQDAFADALAMAEGKSFAPAEPAAPRAPVAKDPNDPWVLDDSLLRQAEANAAANAAAPPGAPAPTPAHLSDFLNLGGIGYIGDPALDEYEPATPHKRVARPVRTPRQRRPVAEDEAPPMSPVHPHIDEENAAAAAAAADLPTEADEATVSGEIPAGRPTRPAAPPAVAATAPLAPGMPMSLPPRPRRMPPRGQATVDQSLAPAGTASPFAGQALPLVDVLGGANSFGGTGVPADRLDEVLARLGPTAPAAPDEGPPPITTDKPAAGLSATPFASHVPIAQPGPPRRRPPAAPRRTLKLPNLLLWIMVGLSAVIAGAAWYWPVPRTVVGELAFENLDRLNSVERARVQDELRTKLAGLKDAARAAVDDRFGDGFLDHDAEFRAVVAAAEFRDDDDLVNARRRTLLVLRRPSDANHAAADRERLDALLKVAMTANQELAVARDAARSELAKKQEQINVLRKQKDALNAEITNAQALAANRPSESELRELKQDVARLDEARQAAAKTLAAREAEFKRLEAEAAALGAALDDGLALAERLDAAIDAGGADPEAAVANVGRSIAPSPLMDLLTGRRSPLATFVTIATPATGVALFAVEEATPAVTSPADAELARLTRDRDAARERLDQLLAGQAPEAKTARESFEKALEAFAGDVEKASKTLGDRPEVLAYVQSARALQDQIRRMTDTQVRRQQQQITRLGEFKRRLGELTEATREQRFGDDPQLKEWNNQLAMRQRQLNAARESGAPAVEIDDTQRQVSLLENMIAARKENLNDPRASVVTKELEGMIATTQREMLQDRADNEKLLAEVQEAFRKQQPAVDKLPDESKELARQLAGRLAQIDLARQRYTNSLGIQAGGEALQIAQARQKLQELDDAVALRKSAVDKGAQAQAAEMERRTRLARQRDEARIALVAARAARDDAEAAYAARVKARDELAAKLESTRKAGAQKEKLEADRDAVDARLSELIVQANALEQQVNWAVVPVAMNAAREVSPEKIDHRLIGGGLGVAAVVLCMSPFVVSAYRRQADLAALGQFAEPAEVPQVEAAAPVALPAADGEPTAGFEPTAPRRPRDPFPPASPKFPTNVTPA